MVKQPLFGQDSSPHITSLLLSSIITLVCWIIFCVLCFVIKFQPKTPQYKEVQIVLSSEKSDDEREKSKSESAAAAVPELISESFEQEAVIPEQEVAIPEPIVEEVVSTPAPAPAPAKPVETPNKETTPAPSPAKTEPAKTDTKTTTPAVTPKATDPAKKVNFDDYQYATDYSDFDLNNVSSNTNKSSFDWSQFDDSSTETQSTVNQQTNKVTTQSSLSGSAAETSTEKNQRQTSQTTSKTQTTQTASTATSTALSNIRTTSYSATTGDSKSITNAKTSKTSDGQISMEMSDGSTRVLLDPITPAIKLSAEAAALIDSTKIVTIKFRVVESGNVPRAEITISPESILPAAVRNEIYDQLSKWRFETALSSATASFEYTIEKR